MDILSRNHEGLNAMQFAIAGKHTDVIQYLTTLSLSLSSTSPLSSNSSNSNSGSLFSEISDSGYNAFHRAAIYGSLETINLLFLSSTNAHANTHNNDNISNNNDQIEIDKKNASFIENNTTNTNNNNTSAGSGNENNYSISIVEQQAYNGNTAIHLACQHDHIDITRYLVEVCSAGMDVQNDYGLTPLHFSCIG